ncbi:hypothetical protein AB0J68_26275 [Micromonospora sp. NPDC049580]
MRFEGDAVGLVERAEQIERQGLVLGRRVLTAGAHHAPFPT